MAKQIKPLNDTKIRNTKPTGKTQTLFDGGGLYLEIWLLATYSVDAASLFATNHAAYHKFYV